LSLTVNVGSVSSKSVAYRWSAPHRPDRYRRIELRQPSTQQTPTYRGPSVVRRHFASDGYLLLAGMIDEALLEATDAEIDELYEVSPAPEGTVRAHFYFLPPGRLAACDAARRDSHQ
jgi:hypothetical protein